MRFQVAVKSLVWACTAALITSGCVAERYRPAATASMDAESENPCADVMEIHHVTPFYPNEAVAKSEEGWVKLKYHVASNGEVFNVRVVASDGSGLFDDASAVAMTAWRYPAMKRPLQNCSHIDVYRFEGGPASLARRPVVLSPRDQAEFAEFTLEESPALPASRR